jgi:hypothetical protein
MRVTKAQLAGLVAALAAFQSTRADTMSISMTGGGNVYAPSSGGGVGTVRTDWSPMLLLSGTSNTHRGWMEYDLSAIPAGATITSVWLAFVEEGGGGITFQVRGGFESGNDAYDALYGLTANTTVSRASFDAMRDDSDLFGSHTLSGASGVMANVDLSNGLSYFNAQIGSEVMLTTNLVNEDMDTLYVGTVMPNLVVEYDLVTVPLPNGALLGAVGLCAIPVVRRKIRR